MRVQRDAAEAEAATAAAANALLVGGTSATHAAMAARVHELEGQVRVLEHHYTALQQENSQLAARAPRRR